MPGSGKQNTGRKAFLGLAGFAPRVDEFADFRRGFKSSPPWRSVTGSALGVTPIRGIDRMMTPNLRHRTFNRVSVERQRRLCVPVHMDIMKDGNGRRDTVRRPQRRQRNRALREPTRPQSGPWSLDSQSVPNLLVANSRWALGRVCFNAIMTAEAGE